MRALGHVGASRTNIPTAELESFARPEEKRPATALTSQLAVILEAAILHNELGFDVGDVESRMRLVRPNRT